MRAIRLLFAAALLTALSVGGAGAAELKVLSLEAMKPALQELAPAFEKEAGHKLKIDYVAAGEVEKKIGDIDDYDVVIFDKKRTDTLTRAAKVVSGTLKPLAKEQGSEDPYVAGAPMMSEHPIAAKALVDFLGGNKAKEAYKAKGLQPS